MVANEPSHAVNLFSQIIIRVTSIALYMLIESQEGVKVTDHLLSLMEYILAKMAEVMNEK